MQTTTCQKPSTQPVQLVRRLIQKFAPVRGARVRYDANRGSWALLDTNNEPVRYFTHGFLQDVTFSSASVTERVGCGGPKTTSIGIATGTLREGIYSPHLAGLTNLAFSQGQFVDGRGSLVTSAKELQLMPNRHALYQP